MEKLVNHQEILLLSGPLKETIWGSNYFKNELKITDNDSIGEMWSCSGYSSFSSIILNGLYKGKTLDEVFKNNKELFANLSGDKFPILIKLIATNDKLSIQVHPDDEYALKNENSLGKFECWLILRKEEGAKLILGNKAKNKEEIKEYINNNHFEDLINEVDVNVGDVYVVNPGTIHGIGKGIILLEIQQSSDITYRFYDYNRLGLDGLPRELHINKALDVVSVGNYKEKVININSSDSNLVANNKYFNSIYLDINGEYEFNNDNEFEIVTSLMDKLIINDNYEVKYGESFIITSKAKKVILKGFGKIIITKANKG